MDRFQDAINKGARAKTTLDDPLFQAAIKQIEADYIEAWKATSAKDVELRERIWAAVQVSGKFKDHLIAVMNDGKLALAEIARLNKKAS